MELGARGLEPVVGVERSEIESAGVSLAISDHGAGCGVRAADAAFDVLTLLRANFPSWPGHFDVTIPPQVIPGWL
jgi:hypothetical protein